MKIEFLKNEDGSFQLLIDREDGALQQIVFFKSEELKSLKKGLSKILRVPPLLDLTKKRGVKVSVDAIPDTLPESPSPFHGNMDGHNA